MGQDYSIESPAQRQHEAVIVPLSVVMKPLQLYSILAVGFVFSSKGKILKKTNFSNYSRINVLRKSKATNWSLGIAQNNREYYYISSLRLSFQ